MGCVRLAFLAWDWALKRAGRRKVQPAAPPRHRAGVDGGVFVWTENRGCWEAGSGLGKTVGTVINRAGNGKRCREVTNRKRWWQRSAAGFRLKPKESVPRPRGEAAGAASASARPRTAAWFAQMLFTLSGHLNNKTRLVKGLFALPQPRGVWRMWTSPHNVPLSHVGANNSASRARRGE